MYVALKDGQVVGTGALIPEDVPEEIQSCNNEDFAKVDERKVMRIVRMSVAKECRRCGVGSVVLASCCASQNRKGAARNWLLRPQPTGMTP